MQMPRPQTPSGFSKFVPALPPAAFLLVLLALLTIPTAIPAQQTATPPVTVEPSAASQQLVQPQPDETLTATVSLPAALPENASPATAATPSFASKEAEGDVLNLRGHYLAAIRAYQAVQPVTPVVLNKVGVSSERMFMYAQARANFEQAIKLRPDYPEAWNNLGTIFHAQADYRHAEKCYRKSLKLKPNNPDVLQNLGTLYYARKDYKKGDAAYKQAIAADPQVMERSAHNGIQSAGTARNRAEMHFHLACTYATAGQNALALEYLRKSILEGFHDRDRMLHEKQLADLRTTEPFLRMADDLRKN